MLLRALNQYEGVGGAVPPGYAIKTLGFVLHIDPDARGCSLNSQYGAEETGKGKSRQTAPSALVPNITRTVKPVPMLACDNASYVLGRPKVVDDPAKQTKEIAAANVKRDLFDDLLREYAEEADDDDARTFLRWRENGCPGLEQAVDGLDAFSVKRLDFDPIAIHVNASGPIHENPAAKRFWSERAGATKSGGTTNVCLSCGERKPVVDTLPQSLMGSLVPATSTANVALVSVNFPSASRGASGTGLRSAPICVDCASGAVSAFNALAADESHRWGRSSEDRATIWWSTGDAFDFNNLDRPQPEDIKAAINALETGRRPVGVLDVDRFYALSFSGNVARLVIRQWIDLPLTDVLIHIGSWFRDSATPDPEREYVGVSEMARSCGSFVPSDGMFSAMPEGSRELLIRCVLTGDGLPRNLLIRAMSRARAEIHYLGLSDPRQVAVVRRRMSARFALIRLTLNRQNNKEITLSQYLDEELDDPAYLSGRLFAERESLQYQALGNLNASITDRFFERASGSPLSVDRALTVLERQHLRTLERKGRRDAAVAFDKRIGSLHERIKAKGLPKQLSVEDQALWVSGYYQQRQENFRRATELKQQKQLAQNTDPNTEEN